MNFQEWVEKYKPIMTDDGYVFAFDTHGKFMEFVNAQDDKNVWTLIDTDDEEELICSGKHWFNRINYYVTKVAWEEPISVVYEEQRKMVARWDGSAGGWVPIDD